ncbi:VOC family protein [Leucobacter allii]|uniref:VOC family protein n=1 Tax=Leucobacter allii TaxID=2932247 RepID=UPI001FD3E632|nr:VOC family protein [Leucobacter allii]UOR03126.1 VOC family protein [Leucobacter allii]
MIGALHTVVLDAPDPLALAGFYREVLGGSVEVDPEEDGPDGAEWVELALAETGPRLAFQRSPGYVAPVWPGDDGDQQLHLDIRVADFDAAEQALLAAGARHLETHRGFRVYLDPVGHPFCTVG